MPLCKMWSSPCSRVQFVPGFLKAARSDSYLFVTSSSSFLFHVLGFISFKCSVFHQMNLMFWMRRRTRCGWRRTLCFWCSVSGGERTKIESIDCECDTGLLRSTEQRGRWLFKDKSHLTGRLSHLLGNKHNMLVLKWEKQILLKWAALTPRPPAHWFSGFPVLDGRNLTPADMFWIRFLPLVLVISWIDKRYL